MTQSFLAEDCNPLTKWGCDEQREEIGSGVGGRSNYETRLHHQLLLNRTTYSEVPAPHRVSNKRSVSTKISKSKEISYIHRLPRSKHPTPGTCKRSAAWRACPGAASSSGTH